MIDNKILEQSGLPQEVWSQCFYINGLLYAPMYNSKANEKIVDGEKVIEYSYEIMKTGEEVYNEQLTTVEQPNETEVRFDQIEEAIGVLATQTAKNTLLK